MLMLFSTALAAADPPDRDPLPADTIIQLMKEGYASARSYRDTGMVREVFTDANGSRTVEKPFSTAFVRPHRFRYEFREKVRPFEVRKFIIYRNRDDLRVHWDLEHDLTLDTLDRAVAAATGVSSESAITVPAMLLPDEITWRRAIRFRKPVRIADKTLRGIDCYRIIDETVRGQMTLWIGKADLLLRQAESEFFFEDFRVQRTTTYNPERDIPVAGELLEFNAPGGRRLWR